MPKISDDSRNSVRNKKLNLVHDARVRCGLGITELAVAVKLSAKTIKRLENGEPTVKLEVKHRVANELSRRDSKYDFTYLFPNG